MINLPWILTSSELFKATMPQRKACKGNVRKIVPHVAIAVTGSQQPYLNILCMCPLWKSKNMLDVGEDISSHLWCEFHPFIWRRTKNDGSLPHRLGPEEISSVWSTDSWPPRRGQHVLTHSIRHMPGGPRLCPTEGQSLLGMGIWSTGTRQGGLRCSTPHGGLICWREIWSFWNKEHTNNVIFLHRCQCWLQIMVDSVHSAIYTMYQ